MKNTTAILVLVLSIFLSGAALPTTVILEARLSHFLEKSENAEIYQITSARICPKEDRSCNSAFEYHLKFEELVYGSRTNAQIYFSDYDVSAGSYVLIFSAKEPSSSIRKYHYFDHFYKLRKTVEMPPKRNAKYIYLVNVGESHMIENIPGLPLPSQETYKICASGKCKEYGAGVFIRNDEFVAAIKKYRAKIKNQGLVNP